ncbi:glycosyltransferase family 4 protein [Aurantiacibacter suaedae]|uniref:glycosyltransferase family 4 protein n=1 Tax=Aurantiacibacter suaedae TaxID=2545755 RepID=UPI0010F9CCD3|nr:glycosyltransferase family 1 protein [Aurantiacibacter suaedae]
MKPINRLKWQTIDFFDRLLSFKEVARVRRLRTSRPPLSARERNHLLVDVSVISRSDAGTGIQRVVRSIRDQIPYILPAEVSADFLTVASRKSGYVTKLGECPSASENNIFVGLDFATDSIPLFHSQLAQLRMEGTAMWFVVYDILPYSNPEWFTPLSRLRYRKWLHTCIALADGLICISSDTAEKVDDIITSRFLLENKPEIVTVELGSDICLTEYKDESSALAQWPSLNAQTLSRAVLMVGTLEPRKGHLQALDAFEEIWAMGCDIPLVIVGRRGWNTEQLQKRIQDHAQWGKLLFWHDNATDDTLHFAYQTCRLTLVASLAEGYGLPLDEALALGSPVLARDIPVFRRHEGHQLQFFPEVISSHDLAISIVAAYEKSRRSASEISLRSWRDCAQELVSAITDLS